jgi:glycosyltransferase involved in cell wall biosynthesis
MNVLVLCVRYPYPVMDGESLRIYHYVRELRARHHFDLVCVSGEKPPAALQSLFRAIEPVPPAKDAAYNRSPLRIVDSLRIDALMPRFPGVTERLTHLLHDGRYDLIWTSSDLVTSIPHEVRVPVLADIVDDMVLQYRRELARARSPVDFLVRAKRLLLARLFERRHFGRADACLFASEVDADCFARVAPGTRTQVIPNGVDAEYFSPRPSEIHEPRLVFEGSMAFPPNADAAVYFCEEILPLIVEQRPDVRVDIVGRDPTEAVRALASGRVRVTGFVDDVRPYLAQGAVFVCPLRTGAGIKNKILQAWAMGKAVVATPLSVGGLAFEEGGNILIRDTPRSFAGAVLELLADGGRRRRLGDAARATIVRDYTWSAKAGELESLMRDLAGTPEVRNAAA